MYKRQELKVQKANQKIFELQRTNEQMGRLLSKIPPEAVSYTHLDVYKRQPVYCFMHYR